MEKPLPTISHLSEPFWEAARGHKLVLQRCSECGAYQWYPKAWCADCGSRELKWKKVTGRGTVYSYTVINHAKASPAFADEVPYAIVVVELDEGPRMYGRLKDSPIEDITTGMRVRVVFEDVSKEISLPQFTSAR
jgi:uncharacterized OB-fold protein